MGEERIRVLIVDDHDVVRQGLATFLELHDDIELVGEASNGVEAVDMAGQLLPDVVLMDLVMPEMDGIAATEKIHASYADMKVIVLTSFTDDDKVFPAIKAGAAGYLLKNVAPADLVASIRAAHGGETQLHPDIARKLMEGVVKGNSAAESLPEELTGRELEVLRLIAQGKNNSVIAEELVISQKTVKTHVSNILGKLDLEDRTQAAIYALKSGLAGGE